MTQFDQFEAQLRGARPSRRPLRTDFTNTTLAKALAAAPSRRHLGGPMRSIRSFSARQVARLLLIVGGTLLAGFALAVTNPGIVSKLASSGADLLGKLVITKTDPHTGITHLSYDQSQCPQLPPNYNLKPGADPAEAAKYLQAGCEMVLALHQLHLLEPNDIKDPLAHVDARGRIRPDILGFSSDNWAVSLGEYHDGSGRPYLVLRGNQQPRLALAPATPVVTAAGDRATAADLHNGDSVLVIFKVTDDIKQRATSGQLNVQGYYDQAQPVVLARLALSTGYYWVGDFGGTLDFNN